MSVDPSRVALFIPPGLAKFKLELFERIGRKIIAAGGRTLRHDYNLVRDLPDDLIPIIGCTPQFRELVLNEWPQRRRQFIFWDRGYLRRVFATWLPRGTNGGYYRWTCNAFQMQSVKEVPDDRWRALDIQHCVRPWHKTGKHILVADTGYDYWDLFSDREWTARTVVQIKKFTDRPIRVRGKEDAKPLFEDLRDAHALVTHGSIAAVESVVMGCPVFVHPFSTARLVGKINIADIECPAYPDREPWLYSLAYSQFNETELVDGTLFRLMW